MTHIKFWALVLVCAGLLGACGIKPGSVDAPKDSDPQTFPKTYPPAR